MYMIYIYQALTLKRDPCTPVRKQAADMAAHTAAAQHFSLGANAVFGYP